MIEPIIHAMKKSDRYDVSGLVEAQFERGSGGRVLRNRLGIRSRRKMDDAEAAALRTAMDVLVRTYDENHRFTAADICAMHRNWLSGIYEWAGGYRNVNLTKDDFPFAAAALVPSLMTRFEHDVLARCTPCHSKNRDEVVHALAQVHVELVLIHPFREGNGRIARALSLLMALQAGLPLLDFSLIAGRRKKDYFAAIQFGYGPELRTDGKNSCGDYRPEPGRVLTGRIFSSLARVRAMVSTLVPVSMAVELETLVMRSLRNFSGSSRYGLVSISGFFRIMQS